MSRENVYQNLVAQLDRLYRHTRQGSYQTRARYYEAMKRLCRFLAEEYGMERLANLAPKHIEAYTQKLQKDGKSAATIKTDLAAIRFFHDQMPNPRYELPDNRTLHLERRSFGKEDRTWSEQEFERMCALAELDGKAVTVIAIEKGHTAKERSQRNFGAPGPEGYRKALRLMKQAEKFKRPVICFIDTSGAYCGIGAEERG